MVAVGGRLDDGSAFTDETWILDWGGTAVPLVGCEAPASADRDQPVRVSARITSRMGARQIYLVRFQNPFRPVDFIREVDGGGVDSVSWLFEFPDTADGAQNLSFEVVPPTMPMPRTTCNFEIQLPLFVNDVSAEPSLGGLRVRWSLGESAPAAYSVHRRPSGGEWVLVARPVPVGSVVEYQDHALAPGARYEYRLGIRVGESEIFRGQIAADVPGSLRIGVQGLAPNPATESVTVTFSLQDDQAARLELLDIAGRMMLSRDIRNAQPGAHATSLHGLNSFPAGLYVLRLVQGGRSASRLLTLAR